ncbi:MAG: glycine zipper 2TM domain-containing protein [Halomonas sp.]|nr:glycine zipper 2TM domain-containing protein [Halomonas sp.]MDN6298581.1 glycine zipper 2TM domain-containing protein [Halomonas sp.]MDN6315764.1 glycine zipper 2TM domain-containing protein [Halomonas sp.]MDN6337206.1 glycine zipper 2TM domain-containing protein [Halomonas sp.]
MNTTSIKTLKKAGLSATVVALMLGLSACSSMSDQDKNTALGAGAGAVGGSVLTGGSTAGTVGGAVVGGVVGHEVDDD